MKSYQWVLFDADDTLFHFDSFSGLRLMFAGFGIEFTARYCQDYQAVNKLLWVDYQNGHIDAQHLQQQRFAPWVDTLQVAAQKLACPGDDGQPGARAGADGGRQSGL